MLFIVFHVFGYNNEIHSWMVQSDKCNHVVEQAGLLGVNFTAFLLVCKMLVLNFEQNLLTVQ